MVRLGDQQEEVINWTERYFNSSMVRLGARYRFCSSYRSVISIPVWCDWEPNQQLHHTDNLWNFNSSMVRLGAQHFTFNLRNVWVFQFQYGAIGRCVNLIVLFSVVISIPVWCDWEMFQEPLINLLPHYFNSSMVRLGDVWNKSSSSLTTKFQFQYGAIGSR